MKKPSLKGRTTVIFTTLFLFLSFYVTYFLHLSSMFYLYYIVAMSATLFLSVNFLFISLKIVEKLKNRYARSEKKAAKRVRAFFTESRAAAKIAERREKKHPGEKRKKREIRLSAVFSVFLYIIYFGSFYSTVKGVALYIQTRPFEIFDYPVNAVVMLCFALACLVLDKLSRHSANASSFTRALLKNNISFLKVLACEFIAVAAGVLVEYYARISLQKIMGDLMAAVFFFCALFVLISVIIVIIRKESLVNPAVKLPLPEPKRGKREEGRGFVEYLEKNTGISMRSLWSVKFIKKAAPTVIALSVLAFWLSTGIVYVNSYSQAAVYRIGALNGRILQPGLHFTLPYPIDRVELYDTEKLSKATIGYNSDANTDNIWTSSHGGNEYKLLLGGGDELVSVNLRLEYKISDLRKYLTVSASPESLMKASAYELVLNSTISTDLASLLSVNRSRFAASFKSSLNRTLEEKGIGLEVVSVVLESIHPPVEIAEVYQSLISAEITADKYMSEAEGYAAVKKAEALSASDSAVGQTNADYLKRTAEAKSSAAQFTASSQAHKQYKDAYTYQKYLSAVRNAYGKANLIILGSGVDSSSVYFGSFANGKIVRPEAGQNQKPEGEKK